MSTNPTGTLVDLVTRNEGSLLQEWLAAQEQSTNGASARISASELESEAREFLRLLIEALQSSGVEDLDGPGWRQAQEHLARLSRNRAEAGFTPRQTATFVFSLKQPLFALVSAELSDDGTVLSEALWEITKLLDSLGLSTSEEFLRGREAMIARQQRELMELSTPVVKLWDGVLAVPLIGTLDSERTQVVMETLLQGIVDTNSTMAIIDITGVPTVDTLVAQHLLKTVAAARLMGADCIISGIRPQIAQTIVHLGLTLSEVTTKATMADAIRLAFEREGLAIVRAGLES
ncbi:MAG TPA: STAS domain-containing protein [Gaiellaceae bacterium]|nr:STAS domain-containing protein [Gaiellaceae bacterium]